MSCENYWGTSSSKIPVCPSKMLLINPSSMGLKYDKVMCGLLNDNNNRIFCTKGTKRMLGKENIHQQYIVGNKTCLQKMSSIVCR